MLWWIGRFRYTTVELLAMRFEVAPQNVRVRLKRLAAAGLVRLDRPTVNTPWMVSLTTAGARALDQPRRKPPRVELHQAHELAIGWLCAHAELRSAPGVVTRTEREMRQLDGGFRREHQPARYAIEVTGSQRGDRTRWPDLLLERDGRPFRAFEIEFTQKSESRLWDIIDGYARSDLPEVVFLTANPHLAAKLTAIAARRGQLDGLGPVPFPIKITVAPWPRTDEATKVRVRASIEAVSRGS